MIKRKQFVGAMWCMVSGLLWSTGACAEQAFPSKPLRIIVTFGAGGSGDLIGRSMAQQLSEIVGQSVIVENRNGAGGISGTEYAARAPADGYTILQYTNALAVNMVLQNQIGYDLFRDFTPLYYAAEAPLVLLVPGSSPQKSVSELLTFAKVQPKGIVFGHGGSGSMSHLSGELFSRVGKIDAVSVGYKGNGPAMADLLGGRLDYYFSTLNDVLPSIKSGRLRALAVTSAQRDSSLPEVPTMMELGYKDFSSVVSWGYLVPKNTPASIVKQLQDALAKAVATPEMKKRLSSVSASSQNSGGAQVMTAKMKAEIARWEPVIKSANITPE